MKGILRVIFYSHDRYRWGWEILFYLLIVGISVIVFAGPFAVVLPKLGFVLKGGEFVEGWSSIAGSVIVLIMVYTGFLFGTYMAQRYVRRSSLSEIGIKLNEQALREFAIGLGLGAIIIAVSVFLSWIFGYYNFTGFSWQYRSGSILLPAIILMLIAIIQPALVEEVIFRGYLFQVILSRKGIIYAVIITSLFFGLMHLTSFDESTTWWMAIISTFLAGFVFAQAFLARMSLWIPFGIHYGWHLFGRLLNDTGGAAKNSIFMVSEVAQKKLITNPTGGGAGIFELVGVGVVSFILWKFVRPAMRRQF